MKKITISLLSVLCILSAAPVLADAGSSMDGAWGNGSDSNGGVGDSSIGDGGLGNGSTSNGGVAPAGSR